VIDLRSDTVTRPTPGMRAAIAAAEVGDEQMREDPTVNELQERAAALLGQERALFLPTATMANQIALKLHGRPGDVLIAEEHSHVLIYEFGGAAVHAGLLTVGLPGTAGRLTAEQVQAALSTVVDDVDQRPGVLVLENTHNVAGGRVWPLAEIEAVVAVGRAAGVGVHMDGARLLNAAVAAGLPAAEIGSRVDTVTLCLSKGLGCPLGAVLAGPSDLMERAWREKFLFGGAMRQAGMVAAAALYALDHNVERLAADHARARRLAEGWHAAGLPVELDRVETNFVQIDTSRRSARRASGCRPPSGRRTSARSRTSTSTTGTWSGRSRSCPRHWGHMSPPEQLTDQLDRLLASAQAEQRLPSVSACVFRDGAVVWERVLGVADVATARPATTADAYRIGSITKTFTAVLVMQLVEEGRIELEAPLRAYLPEAPVGPTVRMALSHLSGLQREPPGEIWESLASPSREELIGGLEDAELVLAPGAHWHYSNLVFALLGEVVMRAAGGSYADVLSRRLLGPLGLERTSLEPSSPRATPYYVDPYADAVHEEQDPELTEPLGAAGWLWSTAADLARWGTFLAEGHADVLPKAALDRMARVQAMRDEEQWRLGWGLGLGLYRRGDRVFAGHGGAMPGFLASLVVQRAERTGAVVLTNTGAGASPEALALDLATAALDGLPRAPEPWSPLQEVPGELEGLLGLWWTEGAQIVLSYRGGRFQAALVGGTPGLEVSWLEPEGPDRWRVAEGRERGEVLRAVRGDDGSVTKLYFATYPLTRAPSTFG
jgi:threonine aldolase